MNATRSHGFWSNLLIVIGGMAMLLGAVDPLEGSLVILPGCGLVTLGTFLKKDDRSTLKDWIAIFILVAFGVTALFVISAFGGIGGTKGHSVWWGLLILPYPIGWLMGIASLVVRLARRLFHRHAASATS